MRQSGWRRLLPSVRPTVLTVRGGTSPALHPRSSPAAMSGSIIPLPPHAQTALTAPGATAPLSGWGSAAPPAPKTSQLQRAKSALQRFKWLILGLVVAGTAGGVIATRFVEPEYVTSATVVIEAGSPLSGGGSPDGTRSRALFDAGGWVPLFQSGAVADEVVRQLGLFVEPERQADSAVFRNVALAESFRTGEFELQRTGRQVRLSMVNTPFAESAALGDSVGGMFGLLWRPDAATLEDGQTVRFRVLHPREAGAALTAQLRAAPRNTFVQFSLPGTDPDRTTLILRTWVERFVQVAGELKRAKLVEQANIQSENLRRSAQGLEQASLALEQFKVGTITLPTEGTIVAPGIAETDRTVTGGYFQQRNRLLDIRTVRGTVDRILASARRTGRISESDLYTLSTITTGSRNEVITGSIRQLNELEADRRAALRIYADSNPIILDLDRRIAALSGTTIPNQAQALLAQLAQEERDLDRRIASAESEMRDIPRRTIEEADLQRNVAISARIYETLAASAQQANLAVETALPDVSVLDWPVRPLQPSNNTVPQILAMAVLGSLAFAIALALLLDRADRKFRYPEQARDGLGLDVLGAVPRLRALAARRADPEEGAQVLESFRLMRMNIRQALSDRSSVALTVSSAAAGDGKSLVASNLAVSFAQAGHRVLLVDGDIRRGSLHAAFGTPQRPGLADLLEGTAPREEALRETQHANITLLPCGTRSRRAPELLASAAMVELLAELRGTYDVVIVDSPPLSAGIDASALGLATGTLVFVVRAGRTDMGMAQAKLADLDRLPIFVPGAVLNSITPKGVYQYYAYDYGYAADDDEAAPEAAEAGEEPALLEEAGRGREA